MEKYLSQLIEDIRAAKANVPPPIDSSLIDEERYLLTYLYELEHNLPQKMSDLLGLQKEIFPPAEQLSEEQMEAVIEAMFELCDAFNLVFEIPEEVPTSFAYNLVVNELEEEVTYISEGFTHLDFCTGDSNGCALGEYCPCLKIEIE